MLERVVALAIVVVVIGAVVTLATGDNRSDERAALMPSSWPSINNERISAQEFGRHLQDVVADFLEGVDGTLDALNSEDYIVVQQRAAELYEMLKADEAWQRENADRILGGCYDDAAEAYSNWHTFAVAAAVQWEEHARTRDPEAAENAAAWLQDSRKGFEEAIRLLSGLSC